MPVVIRPRPAVVGKNDDRTVHSEASLLRRVSFEHGRRHILQTSFKFPPSPGGDGGDRDGSGSNNINANGVVPQLNGLVHTVLRAFQQDLHLTLRPDDIWLAILTQFSLFVNGPGRAERLRSLFVTHDSDSHDNGRRRLRVDISPWTLAEVGAAHVAICMVDLVRKALVDGGEAADMLLPNFTTTTETDRATAAMAFLGSMRKCFVWECDEGCGFPSVTLLGERGDWASMLGRVAWIASSLGPRCGNADDDEREVAAWTRCLTGVLEGMVASFDGPDDARTGDFWMRACHTAGEHDSGATVTLSGWLTAFCWWDGGGGRQRNFSDAELKEVDMGRLPDERTRRLVLDGVGFPVIERDGIPAAVSHAPMTVLTADGDKYETLFLAGLTGMQLDDEEATRVRPVSGWWLLLGDEKTRNRN